LGLSVCPTISGTAAKVLNLPAFDHCQNQMKRIAYLENTSPFGKLLLLVGLILIFSILTALSGLLIGKIYFGTNLTELASLIANPDTPEAIGFVKFFQLINQVGIFILPVLAYSIFVSITPGNYLQMDSKPTAVSLLLAGLMVYSVLPFLNYLAEWNQQIVLPETFWGIEQWMKEKELQASQLTEMFLRTESISGLSINLFIVALIPAIGEELLFRGVLLRLLKEMTKSIHWAVIISAFLFSAIHLQFYGFFPRFLLGLILGYSFVFTQNLWVPVFLHFINNASSVIIYYLHYNRFIKTSMDNFGASPNPVFIIGSLLATAWLLQILYQKEGQFRA
jgi:membrane protease YdiL (CAAX protease family)